MEKTIDEIMDLTLVQAEPVVMDYETMKEKLSATLEQYQGIEVTEATLKTCKDKQKEVVAIRNQLDDFRKAVKKRYQEPLQIFEDQVKAMIGMVKDVETPLKKGIKEFDDLRRAEKKELAERIIDELVGEYELKEKYSGHVELKSKYTNLTAKESEVRADVEAQCMALKRQQDSEELTEKAIIKAVELQNENIVAKMTPTMYTTLIGKIPTDEIISRIIKRGDEIRKLETEATRVKNREQNQEKEPDIQSEIKTPENGAQEPETISAEPEDTTLYKVTFVITGSADKQKALSRLLKDNGYSYSVESQIILE